MPRTCTLCGGEFHGRADAKFCSQACRQRAHRDRHRPYVPDPIGCMADLGLKTAEPQRPGVTGYSKQIQAISASIADACAGFTDEQVAEALGAAQFLYELLRGGTASQIALHT